jgi:hypothetical protein
VHGTTRVLVGIVAAIVLGSAACAASGAGPGPAAAVVGFNGADRWTFPLVGPLEDDLLITAVTVRGHGPYLFAIDPDANLTVIDEEIVEEAQLGSGKGPVRVDENGAKQIREYAELVEIKIGDLSVAHCTVMVVPANFYDTRGRHLNGVLGRDIIRSSLVFGFDRDQGIATLSTSTAFTPPADAVTIDAQPAVVDPVYAAMVTKRPVTEASGREEASQGHVSAAMIQNDLDVVPIPRQVTTVQVGDAKLSMHIDLGSPVSQLRESLWEKIRLAPGDVSLRLVDEAATVRRVNDARLTSTVALGAAKASHIVLIPYVDKRFPADHLDGALGLDFFATYSVYAQWQRNAFYLKPRGDLAAATTVRLSRWSPSMLPACPHAGCITAKVIKTDAGLQLSVVRDAEAANRPLEVFLGVIAAAGRSPVPLAINLPKTVDKIIGGLPPDYEGASFTVLDASPFARECDGEGGCVFAINHTIARGDAPSERSN